MGRIFPPNFVLHIQNIVSLVLNIMQVLMIIEFVRKSDGVFQDISTYVLMLPTYIQFSLKLLIQVAAFVIVAENAVTKERKHPIFLSFNELHSFLPVFEHLIPVLTYLMLMLCAIAIGSCHLYSKESNASFCQNMSVSATEGIIAFAIVIQLIHHLLGIYHQYRHTSSLESKWEIDDDSIGMSPLTKSKSIVTDLESVGTEVSKSMNWWKFRMNRLFSANLANNLCKTVDTFLEGVQIILLIRAFHVAKGDMKNVPNWFVVMIPLHLCFFLKLFMVSIMLIYVSFRTCSTEPRSKVLHLLSEPKGWIQIAEHTLPFVVYLAFGLTSLLTSKCIVKTKTGSESICSIFSWPALESLIIFAGIVMFLYHVKAIHGIFAHGKKWKTKREKYSRVDLDETACSVN